MKKKLRSFLLGINRITHLLTKPNNNRITIFAFTFLIFMCLIIPGCKKAVLTAPDNSTLIVTVNPPVIPLGGQAIIRVVGFKASGTPVPDGTVVFFSTDIGTIESRKETQNGEAEALFKSNDNRSGTANITITSGNATISPESITITIGTSGLYSLSIIADPPTLPVGGGATIVRVTAHDEDFNPLANIPITLHTDNGHLNSGGNPLTTGSNGVVQDLLQTTETAIITASSGDIEISITINVADNDSPTASFVFSPNTPKVGENVHFNAAASSDPDGTIISYQWDFGDGHSATGTTVTHKFRAAGTYSVVLVVEDNSGKTAASSQSVSVSEGSIPNASFVHSPQNPDINETVYFNASGSTDSDGTIIDYEWDFGDGTKGSGQTVTHKYSKSGTYYVLLKVTDDDDNSDTTSESITIGDNEKPTATFSYSPTNPNANEDIYFNATASQDPDGTIVSYEWDFGDNTFGTGVTITHRYTNSGTYRVYLKVTDNSGNVDNYNDDITIGDNKTPTASFVYSPTSPAVGESVHFNGSDSIDPDGTIVQYSWDFGDGKHGSSKETQHTYTDIGTYTVVLVVTDNSGNSDSVSKTLTVVKNNNMPVASFTYSPANPDTTTEVNFNASDSTDPDGNITEYTWDFGDGDATSSNISTAQHQYNSPGTYTVWLTVKDDDDNTDSTSRTITVN